MKKHIIDIIKDIILTILILTISTILGGLIKTYGFHETNVVVIYIFSILLISRYTKGYIYGISASVISILLFNWFFTAPYFTLKVYDMTYLITFAIMMITSIMTSTLTTKAKENALEAKMREAESNALYQMTNHLTDAEDATAIAQIAINTTSEVLNCNTACICFDDNGNPEKTFLQRKEDGSIIRREFSHGDELKKRMEKLLAFVDITDKDYLYPIYGKTIILAVLRIPKSVGEKMTPSQTRMLHSIIESATLALERLRSIKEQARSMEETAQERYQSNLLRAISHDIRTPLSGIMGTSEMLMDASINNEEALKLANDIYDDAQWLYGLVENILNLTKLQDGKIKLNKQSEAIEEVIGATLAIMEKRLPDRIINVEMPDNVVIAPMDARLISQVLINLIDNANKHTPKDKEIKISVVLYKDEVEISVSDEGTGIPEYDLPHIFTMFYTTSGKSSDSRRGVGLGLAICQSIIEAHGGTIYASNQKDGGAKFTFFLPLDGEIYE